MNYRPRSHGRFPSPFLGNDHPFQPDYRPASQDYPCEWGVPYDNRGPPPPRHNHQFYQPPHGGMPPRYPPQNRYPVQSWLGSTNPQYPPPPPPWNHPQRPPAPRPHMWRGNSSYPRSHSQSRNNNRNENIEFFCETCDRGFKTQDKFSTHVSEHEQCRVKGCHYVAAPKLVKIHYQTQHVTGLADKIWSLESKEDIDKWRLERKKNFPTKLRVAEKEKEEKQKIIRGEVLETQQFGKMYRGRGRGRGRRGRGGGAHQVPQNLRLTPDIKQFTPEVKETSVVGGGLGLLSAMYDSDEDAPQDEAPKTPEVVQKSPPKRGKRKKKGEKKKGQAPAKKVKPTLLEQLLSSEIRHERNVLLQCVRYVVKTEFLGILSGQKKEKEQERLKDKEEEEEPESEKDGGQDEEEAEDVREDGEIIDAKRFEDDEIWEEDLSEVKS